MITIDEENARVVVQKDDHAIEYPLQSAEAFEAISKMWLRCGWDMKHVYTFSWLGRPLIQLPEDVLRIQEVVYQVRPDVLIETGVAHGGGLVFYASLFKTMGVGRVIGVDIEIRPHNRLAIESHFLKSLITLIEGSSIAPEIVAQVKSLIKPGERVMVVLDSNHTKDHVLAELEAYSPLVGEESYIVATDGIMRDLEGAPRSKSGWATDNPYEGAQAFLKKHPEFEVVQPKWLFDESEGLRQNITYWPGSYLRRRKAS